MNAGLIRPQLVIKNQTLYVFGGQEIETNRFSPKFYSFDLITETIEQLPDLPQVIKNPLVYMNPIDPNANLILLGGINTENQRNTKVFIFNPFEKIWSKIEGLFKSQDKLL